MSKIFVLLSSLVLLTSCFSSNKYAVGDCSHCQFEDDQNSSPKVFYKVTAINKELQEYSLSLISKDPALATLQDTATWKFKDLDEAVYVGKEPQRCKMVKVACPQ